MLATEPDMEENTFSFSNLGTEITADSVFAKLNQLWPYQPVFSSRQVDVRVVLTCPFFDCRSYPWHDACNVRPPSLRHAFIRCPILGHDGYFLKEVSSLFLYFNLWSVTSVRPSFRLGICQQCHCIYILIQLLLFSANGLSVAASSHQQARTPSNNSCCTDPISAMGS